MPQSSTVETKRTEKWVNLYRRKNSQAGKWAKGYGVIEHTLETQARIFDMAEKMEIGGVKGDGVPLFQLLRALDKITNAAMWVVVHETYARNVYLDGRSLAPEDFKAKPEGHTGGALNMVPAYAGYMAINAMTGLTRSWIMGQGHTVAAIDTVNLLLDNMTAAHSKRYSITDEGLTRYVRDFYSYKLTADGKQDSPLGSHVNPHTAGGIVEGGYLGFTELQYVHMPLPGETLVVFLSDGAFEEQRGSDWTPRWWRSEDSGFVLPIMINNGRRIDQRTTMSQQGGASWFVKHLGLNNFDPFVFDGRDPAAFVWAIYEMESKLEAAVEAIRTNGEGYPIRMPYGIAVALKGAGFHGEGTNLAHALPLMGNPHTDSLATHNFNEGAKKLWVPLKEWKSAASKFKRHETSGRLKEREHALVDRSVKLKSIPEIASRPVPEDRLNPEKWTRTSPMFAVDSTFISIVEENPHLRPRVGNPDEMKSNRLLRTLEALKFRVTHPEPDVPEDIHGAVITALNEEAVASAALANKGGINLIHTYEAFGTKMQGVIRQEIIFTDNCNEIGRNQGWLSVPLVLTSHTWENAKNELSHQDPAMAESMLGEFSNISRVVFPADYNSTAVAMNGVYQTHGQIWTLVVTKYETAPDMFTPEESERLLRQGAIRIDWAGHEVEKQQIVLTAMGSYQFEETIKASIRLAERGIPHSVVYMIEPGRFREPRSIGESNHVTSKKVVGKLYPDSVENRLFVTHIRPEPLLGVLQPLNTGMNHTRGLGFLGQGGTLTPSGMLFVNKCTWAHILQSTTELMDMDREDLLTEEEVKVLDGKMAPEGIVI